MWSFMANLVQLEHGDYVLLCKKGCVIMTQKCHDDTPPACDEIGGQLQLNNILQKKTLFLLLQL